MASSTGSVYEYHCNMYQPEEFVHGNYLVPSRNRAVVFIDFFVSVDGLLKHNDLTLPREGLTLWPIVISGKLAHLHVPYQSQTTMIMTITNYARSLIDEERNMNRNIIPMVVMITAVGSHNPGVEVEVEVEVEEEAVSQAATLSINGQAINMVAASESSIQALKIFRVEEDSQRQCVICLEEISVGSEATRMPCSHVYHQDCIVSWLQQSNLCPLCRFQMQPEISFVPGRS